MSNGQCSSTSQHRPTTGGDPPAVLAAPSLDGFEERPPPGNGERRALHAMFEAWSRARPDDLAIICDGEQITYGQLQRRAAHCARQLLTFGVRRDGLVGLCADRSIDMIVGMFAVLKAGGAFVPLDPTFPAERLAFMVDDAQMSIVLVQKQVADQLPLRGHQVVYLDGEEVLPAAAGAVDSHDSPFEWPDVDPDQLAYVMYTSGSTGRPKGVMITHRSAVNTIVDVNHRFGVRAGDRTLALSSPCFDLSVFDVFGLLAVGGTVVIPNSKQLRDPAHWVDLLERHQISVWNSVPAFMEMLVTYVAGGPIPPRFDSLRLVMLSGDWIPVSLPDRVRQLAPRAQVISLGGATEGAIWSIYYRIESVDPSWKSIPYGVPLGNQEMWVLDDKLQHCAPGVVGQLYIGGVGVASGYWNRPELNAEAFLPDPFSVRPGARIYRTGDLGRYLPDGNIEFLGRVDQQVKIHGFRIELGEIESALARHPDVAQAVVVTRELKTGGRSLVAFLVPRPGTAPDDAELTTFLRRSLPDYMLPTRLVRMERMPLNTNGKIDRDALPTEVAAPSSNFMLPDGDIEVLLAAIWEEAFDLRPLGVCDNFFDLGGDSLLAAGVLARINDKFGYRLTVDMLFAHPTIGQLAEVLRGGQEQYCVSHFVVLQSGTAPAPLVCVPGIVGALWDFHKLARYLGPEMTIWGMQQVAEADLAGPANSASIRELADRYLVELRRRQAHGPFYLLGYSFGGPVVYEMAQQLRRDGEVVAFLGLIDAPVGGLSYAYRKLQLALTGFSRARVRIRRLVEFAKDGRRSAQDAGDGPERAAAVERKRLRALDAFVPGPYPGRVTVFKASIPLPWRKRLFDRVTLDWLKLAQDGGTVHMVPGDHFTLFDDGNIEVLADQIRLSLASTPS